MPTTETPTPVIAGRGDQDGAASDATKLLPAEPTDEMLIQGLDALCCEAGRQNKACADHPGETDYGRGLVVGRTMHNGKEIAAAYRAMYAAAPQPRGSGDGQSGRPIETAPRGEKYSRPRILVKTREGLWRVAAFNGDEYAKTPRPFWDMEGLRTLASREQQPTEWLPLPPASTAEETRP